METTCVCGVTYNPPDIYARNRHEASAKHLKAVANYTSRHEKDNVTDETTPDPYTETFSDLDLDDEPAPVAKAKPKRKAKTYPRSPIRTPEKVRAVEVHPQKTSKVAKPKSGDHKVCRVCGENKTLEEYRRKASRPDGRDTICAACSKDWFIAHKAKKAGAK